MIPGLLLDKRVFIWLALIALLAVQVYFLMTGSAAAGDGGQRHDCGTDRATPACFR